MMISKASETRDDDRDALIRQMRAYHAVMIAARTDTLDRLLARDFSLTHITGHEQPKREWFDVINSGQFDYHTIDIDEGTIAVSVTGSTAVLTARGIFDATIEGARRPWRLQFALRYAAQHGRWTIMHARYARF